MKRNQRRLIGLGLIGIVGLVIWNAPGVKSRRLGRACNHDYEVAMRLEGISNQQKIFSTARDACYTNIAREYQNTQLCDLITEKDMKNFCLIHVRYWDKTAQECEVGDQKDICLHIVSIKQRDKGICSRISDDSIKGLCVGEVE